MSEWLKLVILSLICYRLAQLFAYDEGPFSAFHWLRIMAGAYDYDKQGRAQTGLGRMMTCPYCLGMWMALILAVIAYPFPDFAGYWLAIAGLQSFLQGLTGGR